MNITAILARMNAETKHDAVVTPPTVPISQDREARGLPPMQGSVVARVRVFDKLTGVEIAAASDADPSIAEMRAVAEAAQRRNIPLAEADPGAAAEQRLQRLEQHIVELSERIDALEVARGATGLDSPAKGADTPSAKGDAKTPAESKRPQKTAIAAPS